MEPGDGTISAESLLAEAGFLGRLARGLVADEHGAADLAQETMLVALERPPRGAGSIRGWLATVAANLARNARRSTRRRDEHERAAARGERVADAAGVDLERLELQRALFELVLALPAEQRDVLYLRYYEGLAPAEIAARLALPEKTVKSRQTRALAALRERLDARSGGDRRRWMGALVPLAVPRAAGSGGALAATLGGVAMKKLVVAGLAVVVASLAWFAFARGGLGVLRDPGLASRHRGELASTREPSTPPPALAATLAPEELGERRPLDPAPTPATGALALTLRRSDGTPAADLPLTLECGSDPAPRVEPFRVRTGAEGTVLVGGLFAGPVRVWFDRDRFEAEVEAGTTRAFEFTLARGNTVEGTVVDPQGAPVAGAEIWGGHTSGRNPGGFRLATSASDGSFRVYDLDAFTPVGARKRGYLPSQGFDPMDMSAGAGGARTVRLVLGARGGSVHGRVLDPQGNPVAHAGVLAGPDGGWTSGANPGFAPEPIFAETDEHGEFALASDLPPGTHPVHASARGFPVWRGEVEVVAGQEASIDIRLGLPARIEGRLLGVDGQPASGVTVTAAEEDRGGWYHERFAPSETKTDEHGWFALDWLAPGLRELNASDYERPQIGRARASVACAAGETATCELRLELGLTIAGTVVDENGAPLAGWSVSSKSPLMQEWYPRQARTDAQGRFRLANLGDSAHDLVVRSPDADDHPRAKLDGVPVGTQDVVLVVADAHAARGTLRGRFLAPAGRAPDGFTFTLWKEGANEGHFLEPAADGEFTAEVLPGRYQVRIAGGGKDLLTSATFAVEPGAVTDMGALAIEAPGRVEISLTGFPGTMLSRLKLALDREGCSTVNLTAEDDVWLSPELMPGRWAVSANTSDLCLRPNSVEVVAGTTTSVELRVEPTVHVGLVFTDPARGEVTVEALDATGQRVFQRRYLAPREGQATDERRLSVGLPTGHATIRVRTHAGLSGQAELEVTPEITEPLRIELR